MTSKLWGDFDSDDDREYLEKGVTVKHPEPVAEQPPVVNVHIGEVPQEQATSNGNSWFVKKDKSESRQSSIDNVPTWRASPNASASTNKQVDSKEAQGWRTSNKTPPKESAGREGTLHVNMSGLTISQRSTHTLTVNGQGGSGSQTRTAVYVQPTDHSSCSPRVSSSPHSAPLLPNPWFYGQSSHGQNSHGQPSQYWINNNNYVSPHQSPRGRANSGNGGPHMSSSLSPRHSTPLLATDGSQSPRVLIVGNGCPSPQNKNYEMDALYDMVPRHLAVILRQQTPSLLKNMVTLLLAQPYGLTWQELCVNYAARYGETFTCPVTPSGATMSPVSILSDCCHRHEGLLQQDTPGKFRVKPELLQNSVRPAVKKALLRLQDESLKRVCKTCKEVLDALLQSSEEVPCPRCSSAASNKVLTTPAAPLLPSPSVVVAPVQEKPPQLMPSDFRDLTVGGDLPNQILAVLPPSGVSFLALPKLFQQKHGVSLKNQLKGKLAEFLATMEMYDLVKVKNKDGPIDNWRVEPLPRPQPQSATQSTRPL